MKHRILMLTVSAASVLTAGGALADDQAAPSTSPTAAAAPAAAPAAPAPAPMSTPAMNPPLSANPNPFSVDAGPLGKIYVTGALTALAFTQTNAVPGDRASWGDFSNAQVFIQKTDGVIQFFVQAGAYSLPDLGTAYVKASSLTGDTYGVVPQAFLKIAPNAEFNIMAGKLPTLIGAEATFSFENANIERGLLWNQENAVNRGVQANYSKGPLTLSLSVNDGFYSNHYTWGTFLVAWALNPRDTITVDGGGDYFGHGATSSFATPLAANNGQIYNLMFSHNSGPLTLTPYLQYTYVPAVPSIGLTHSASTFGLALIAKYSFTPALSVALRGEYISSTGNSAQGAPNLLYGPGSNAWSLTFTPTYQFKIFFVRGEVSYVKADGITPGFAFGQSGAAADQTRAMIETGVLF
jgi:Putative beta-barrel porin-2, OmpL-like. bbp2